MYRRPRRKKHIGWLAVLLAAALVAAGGWGLYKWLSGTPALDRNAVLLPTLEKEGVFGWKDGVLSVYGNKLICNDLKGTSLWTSDLPAANMKAYRQGDLTVAWGGKLVTVFNKEGVGFGYVIEAPGDVVMAVPGVTSFAAVVQEEGQHRLRVYSVKDGSEVDERLFPYASVLGMGYFGEKMAQLWVLSVDSHGTQPVTRLSTVSPGKASSGEITVSNEIGYAAVLQDKRAWLVGTHTLSSWEHAGESQPRMLVYGWNLQDVLVEGPGRVSFLFSPAGTGERISSLWYVSTDGRQYRFPLPAGCFKAMLKENGRICAVTRAGVYSMAQNGSASRFHPLTNTVDSIPAVVPGKAFVVQSSHRNYLVPMP